MKGSNRDVCFLWRLQVTVVVKVEVESVAMGATAMGRPVIVFARAILDPSWVTRRFGELVAHYQVALRLYAVIEILARNHRN
ncbi:hypothetical protein N7451_007412 [Penicillium sp. IBT 35674x]|nr:hypothetical protein N7451_007412 [Penicillium sp. IBT 35674x]